MKKTLAILGLIALMGCAALIPIKVGPPLDITIEATPERLDRGEYLAKNVMACLYCHSTLDWDYWAGRGPAPGSEGAGGWHEAESMGLIGGFDIYFSNITPAAIGDWTDGELIRAIFEGVSRDGKPLFMIMPYGRYRNMNKEDVYSVVAYIRTLKPIENPLPQKKVKRILKMVERSFPKPWDPQPKPDPSDKVAYGRYLATIGDCIMCHTPMTNSGKLIEGMELAGGNEYKLPKGGVVVSSNITPDRETGIGSRSKKNFIGLFKSYQNPMKLTKDEMNENTLMPWPAYAGMTDEDLGAIYDYLKSVKPVKNEIEKWPTETK